MDFWIESMNKDPNVTKLKVDNQNVTIIKWKLATLFSNVLVTWNMCNLHEIEIWEKWTLLKWVIEIKIIIVIKMFLTPTKSPLQRNHFIRTFMCHINWDGKEIHNFYLSSSIILWLWHHTRIIMCGPRAYALKKHGSWELKGANNMPILLHSLMFWGAICFSMLLSFPQCAYNRYRNSSQFWGCCWNIWIYNFDVIESVWPSQVTWQTKILMICVYIIFMLCPKIFWRIEYPIERNDHAYVMHCMTFHRFHSSIISHKSMTIHSYYLDAKEEFDSMLYISR